MTTIPDRTRARLVSERVLGQGGDWTNGDIRFSIITPCVGRVPELLRLLDSLLEEARHDVVLEWIVIDQDPHHAILDELEARELPFRWKYIACPHPSVSVKRNVGIRHSTGDVVHFMDDDAWYSGTTLHAVDRYLRDQPVIGVSTCLRTGDGRLSLLRWARKPTNVTKYNYHRTSIGPTVFYRRSAVTRVGFFDETKGPGTPSLAGSTEDTDFILRAAAIGTLPYRPDIHVHHDDVSATTYDSVGHKLLRYGYGDGERWRRERYAWWFRWWIITRRLIKLVVLFATGRGNQVRQNADWVRGLVLGYRGAALVDDRTDPTDDTDALARRVTPLVGAAVAGAAAATATTVLVARHLPATDITTYAATTVAVLAGPVLGRLGSAPAALTHLAEARMAGNLAAAAAHARRFTRFVAPPTVVAALALGIGVVAAIDQPRPGVRAALITAAVLAGAARALVRDLLEGIGPAPADHRTSAAAQAVLTLAVVATVTATASLTLEWVLGAIAAAGLAVTLLAVGHLRHAFAAAAAHAAPAGHRDTAPRPSWSTLLVEATAVLARRGDAVLAAGPLAEAPAAAHATASTLAASLEPDASPADRWGMHTRDVRRLRGQRLGAVERAAKRRNTIHLVVGLPVLAVLAIAGAPLLRLLIGDAADGAATALLGLGAGHVVAAALGGGGPLLVLGGEAPVGARFCAVVVALGAPTLLLAAQRGSAWLAIAAAAVNVVLAIGTATLCYLRLGISVVPDRRALHDVRNILRRTTA
jgi:glycosyltransferase involved in cell wall biosynthesis